MTTTLDKILHEVESIDIQNWRFVRNTFQEGARDLFDGYYSTKKGDLRFDIKRSNSLEVYDCSAGEEKLLLTIRSNPVLVDIYRQVATYIREQRDIINMMASAGQVRREQERFERANRGYDGDLDTVLNRLS